jgi:alkanesulfonate monooxygenase SsuD/methylene tetrahydromethanopterin reductase-like flavin-dependent oxidoreductase (luciferase family)
MGAARPLQFGISVIPYADEVDRVKALVQAADKGGLELVGVQDHPYQHRFLDAFALVATLLAETTHVSLFTDVANLPLRPPAVLAKAAASLDVLSGGRFELGLGGGAFGPGIVAMGGPQRTGGETVEAVEEAIEVIRLMWSDQPSVSFKGRHYRIEDARPGPPPTHPTGIWLGAFRPRMIRVVGRKADGWVPSYGVLKRDELRAGNEQIDAAAESAGRDPGQIRRVLNLQGVIGESTTPPTAKLPVGYLRGADPFAGPPEWWAETLRGFVDDGFDTLIFWAVERTPEQIERFAGEVVPLLA